MPLSDRMNKSKLTDKMFLFKSNLHIRIPVRSGSRGATASTARASSSPPQRRQRVSSSSGQGQDRGSRDSRDTAQLQSYTDFRQVADSSARYVDIFYVSFLFCRYKMCSCQCIKIPNWFEHVAWIIVLSKCSEQNLSLCK